MDQPTIIDSSSPASVSAGIAAANLLLTLSSEKTSAEDILRFPGEDGGRSLADVAQGDLDAALQLLADRAQYITGASGAAIALRRGEHADMLCRASAGLNAPELGALLSMEYGLSGESVRTGRALRCDDAERDPRVNHEGCRHLGIASVVIMPIISERQVLGVFELFSGKPHAFDERDVSALHRLGEMVETAVKQAIAAQAPEVTFARTRLLEAQAKTQPASQVQSSTQSRISNSVPGPPMNEKEVVLREEVKADVAATKPLFWSAAMRAQGNARPAKGSEAAESTVAPSVPPVLRRLQKCGACGFPVSPGRTFCVECEEKQWRGQRLSQPEARDQDRKLHEAGEERLVEQRILPRAVLPTTDVRESSPTTTSVLTTAVDEAHGVTGRLAPAHEVGDDTIQDLPSVPVAARTLGSQTSVEPSPEVPTELVASAEPDLFSISTAQPLPWFAANKYVLGALLVVALVIGAIAWLR